MEIIVSMLVLAIAVSLDGFGVGIAYGLRRIRIPLLSVVIIACCSGFIIWLSMQAGRWLSLYLSDFIANLIGAVILMLIGSWSIVQFIRSRHHKPDTDASNGDSSPSEQLVSPDNENSADEATSDKDAPKQVILLELKRLGLVIQILRTPQAADVDKSGNISAMEAFMLGTALSLDAFGAGLGAALLGLPALATAIVIAFSSALLLVFGLQTGFRFSAMRNVRLLALLPGVLLVVIGVLRMM